MIAINFRTPNENGSIPGMQPMPSFTNRINHFFNSDKNLPLKHQQVSPNGVHLAPIQRKPAYLHEDYDYFVKD